MSLTEIVRSSISRAGVIRVRNALNPLLWLSAVGPALAWATAYFLREQVFVCDALVALGSLPILGTLIAYFILLFQRSRSPSIRRVHLETAGALNA